MSCFFSSRDWIFGALTLFLPFLPFLYNFILRRNLRAYRQLPIFHEVQNYKICKKIEDVKIIIASLEKERESLENEDEKEKLDLQILYFLRKEQKLKSEGQIAKCYQGVLESGLQYILQNGILVDQSGKLIFGFANIFTSGILKGIQMASSFISVLVTFMNMFFELPFQVGHKIVIPTVSYKHNEDSLLKKVWSSICSFTFGTLICKTVFISIRFLMYGQNFTLFTWHIATKALVAEMALIAILLRCYVEWILRTRKILPEAKESLLLGCISGIICPSVIGIFEEPFGLMTIFISIFFGILRPVCVFILVNVSNSTIPLHYFSEYIRQNTSSSTNETQIFDKTLSEFEQMQWDNIKRRLENTLLVEAGVVPTVFVLLVVFVMIGKRIHFHEKIQYVIESKDIQEVEKCFYFSIWNMLQGKYDKSGIIPNLEMTPFVYATVLGFKNCIAFMLSGKRLCIKPDFKTTPPNRYILITKDNVEIFKNDGEDLEELQAKIKSLDDLIDIEEEREILKDLIRLNKYFGKTGLIIASETKSIDMLKLMVEKLPANCLNDQDSQGRTGFIYACMDTKSDTDLTRQAVRLYLEKAEVKGREIDLSIKDADGQTGFDYLPKGLLEEFASEFPDLYENQNV